MNTRLAEALAVVEQLPSEKHEACGKAFLESATRVLIDQKIVPGEESFGTAGGESAEAVFHRLTARYDG